MNDDARQGMLRLVPWLILVAVLAAVAWSRQRAGSPARSGSTFRPQFKPRWGHGRAGAGAARGTAHVLSRTQLQGVRDAYSSLPIDPSHALCACAGCQAVYHEASVAALGSDNDGRCVVCGGDDLGPVRVVG